MKEKIIENDNVQPMVACIKDQQDNIVHAYIVKCAILNLLKAQNPTSKMTEKELDKLIDNFKKQVIELCLENAITCVHLNLPDIYDNDLLNYIKICCSEQNKNSTIQNDKILSNNPIIVVNNEDVYCVLLSQNKVIKIDDASSRFNNLKSKIKKQNVGDYKNYPTAKKPINMFNIVQLILLSRDIKLPLYIVYKDYLKKSRSDLLNNYVYQISLNAKQRNSLTFIDLQQFINLQQAKVELIINLNSFRKLYEALTPLINSIKTLPHINFPLDFIPKEVNLLKNKKNKLSRRNVLPKSNPIKIDLVLEDKEDMEDEDIYLNQINYNIKDNNEDKLVTSPIDKNASIFESMDLNFNTSCSYSNLEWGDLFNPYSNLELDNLFNPHSNLEWDDLFNDKSHHLYEKTKDFIYDANHPNKEEDEFWQVIFENNVYSKLQPEPKPKYEYESKKEIEKIHKNSSVKPNKFMDDKKINFSGKYAENQIKIIDIEKAPKEKNESIIQYQNRFNFTEINIINTYDYQKDFISIDYRDDFISFSLKTCKDSVPSAQNTVSFIFAGRKEKARVPLLENDKEDKFHQQRVIVVVTQQEYDLLEKSKYFHKNLEFLVIHELKGPLGTYNNLSLIQTRRLAAFLVSYLWNLKDCLYLDDNLLAVHFSGTSPNMNNWCDVVRMLKQNKCENNALITGFHTIPRKRIFVPDFLYKLFYLDFSEIKNLLNLKTIQEVFILSYPNQYCDHVAEDFYFQIILGYALEEKNRDFNKISNNNEKNKKILNNITQIEKGAVERASKRASNDKNSAKNSVKRIEDLRDIEIKNCQSDQCYSQSQNNWIAKTIDKLQSGVNQIEKDLEKRKNKVHNGSHILSNLYHNNQIVQGNSGARSLFNKAQPINQAPQENLNNSLSVAIPNNDKVIPKKIIENPKVSWKKSYLNYDIPFFNFKIDDKDDFQNYLNQYDIRKNLYEYQKNAMQMLAKHQHRYAVLKISMGSGKTRLQIILANYLASKLKKGQQIHIVTEKKQLVEQFYQAFAETLKLIGKNAYIQIDKVVRVMSNDELYGKNCPVKMFLNNQNTQQEAQVLIFCYKSYQIYLNNEGSKNLLPPLMLFLDEFHLYQSVAKEAFDSKLPLIALSATPPREGPDPCFKFGRKDSYKKGYTAPLIVDKVPDKLDPIKIEEKITPEDQKILNGNFEKIANVLKTYYHPNGLALKRSKGIIYVASINESERLREYLEKNIDELKNHIFTINSKNSKSCKEKIKQFNEAPYNEPKIAIVIHMLQTGYDDKNVMWILPTRELSLLDTTLQMLGRAVRYDQSFVEKIAYMITFSNFTFKRSRTKDVLAIYRANEEYFNKNRPIIIYDILEAIKQNTHIKNYQLLLRHKMLNLSVDEYDQFFRSAIKHNRQAWQFELILAAIEMKIDFAHCKSWFQQGEDLLKLNFENNLHSLSGWDNNTINYGILLYEAIRHKNISWQKGLIQLEKQTFLKSNPIALFLFQVYKISKNQKLYNQIKSLYCDNVFEQLLQLLAKYSIEYLKGKLLGSKTVRKLISCISNNNSNNAYYKIVERFKNLLENDPKLSNENKATSSNKSSNKRKNINKFINKDNNVGIDSNKKPKILLPKIKIINAMPKTKENSVSNIVNNKNSFFANHQPKINPSVQNLLVRYPLLSLNNGQEPINLCSEEISDILNWQKDNDKDYSGEYINCLLYPLYKNYLSLKVSKVLSMEIFQENECQQLIQENLQHNNYIFIPLNLPLELNGTRNNHFVAIILEKEKKRLFYLDPAIKDVREEIKQLANKLGYTIQENKIDFQEKEKLEIQGGWLRHCGAFTVEIFKFCFNYINSGNKTDNLLMALNKKNISPRQINSIRENHKEEVCQIIEKHINEEESKKLNTLPLTKMNSLN